MIDKAILYVMDFYGITREDALKYYLDEIQAATRLFEKGVLE